MTLGILLPPGESLTNMAAHGQDVRFIKYYLQRYCRHFEKVYLFTYQAEKFGDLPKNCELISPKIALHRYLYALLMPFLEYKDFSQCNVFRCFHPSSTVPAILAKILLRSKFVFNYNYDYAKWAVIENKKLLVPLINLLQWLAFKLCDHVFVTDEEMQKYAQKLVSSSKITIVRNAVDTKAFKPVGKTNDETDRRIILSVGRLETQKNYLQLIEAISKLKTKGVSLLIVGKGSLRDEIVHKAKQLGVKLKIVDVVPHDKLPEIYNRADVYVQPSLIEAPVKTLLEAMSCGLPCVATNVPGIKAVITNGKTGLLSEVSSVDLANKLDRLITDRPFAKKIGLAARSRVSQKYDLFKFLELETRSLKSV